MTLNRIAPTRLLGWLLLICVYNTHAIGAEWVPSVADSTKRFQIDRSLTVGSFVTYRLSRVSQNKRGAQTEEVSLVEVDCEGTRRREARSSNELGTKWFTNQDSLDPKSVAELRQACRLAELGAGTAPPKSERGEPEPDSGSMARSNPPVAILRSGSGFFVTTRLLVTNYHVIDGCGSLVIRRGNDASPANIRAVTERNDLALLSIALSIGSPPPIRTSAFLGEDVVAVGHPLSGLLSDGIIVTGGQVNSLAGLNNDPNLIQISAPVQPGSSGGPLLDRSGAVVGVVVSKLNADGLSKVTGDISQNVNFAIKPEVLRLFLDTNRVDYNSTALGQRMDNIKVAERARAFTVQVLCRK
jgi:S1-C subfamily serine protease